MGSDNEGSSAGLEDKAAEPGIVFDVRRLHEAHHRNTMGPIRSNGCVLERVAFESSCSGFLWGEDRECIENNRFDFPLFIPEAQGSQGHKADDLVVIMNGLNETAYTKLFPWAVNLALMRGSPTAIFPMAFHLNRRPRAWLSSAPVFHRERAVLRGNRKSSPYNAALSRRLSDRPGRLFRGGLQTCGDLVGLAKAIMHGCHPQLSACLSTGARLHFLGYSAGGYVTLVLLLADEEGLFAQSRCFLFASCADRDGLDPGSILILDTEAAGRVMDYYGEGRYPEDEDEETRDWLANRPEGKWFREILRGNGGLSEALASLGGRVTAFAGIRDRVISANGMARALKGIPLEVVDLGIHEYPFNLEGPLKEDYDSSQGRRLLVEIGRSASIPEQYQGRFVRFIRKAAEFL